MQRSRRNERNPGIDAMIPCASRKGALEVRLLAGHDVEHRMFKNHWHSLACQPYPR